MDLNKVMLIGNLTRDPEVRTTPQGVPVASFGLATNLIWKDQSGNKKYRTEIILDSMIMLDRKEGGGSYQPSAPIQTEPESVQAAPPASEEVNIEEIPF